MTVYWVRSTGSDALGAMAAVEQALAAGDTGEPPAPAVETDASTPDREQRDDYLEDNLELVRSTWPIDPSMIVASQRPGLAAALNAFQRLVRRATWWYSTPQWQQTNQFHGGVVRVIESLLNRQRQDRERIEELAMLVGSTRMNDRRIETIRMELKWLRRRIAELEAQLAAQSSQPEGRESDG